MNGNYYHNPTFPSNQPMNNYEEQAINPIMPKMSQEQSSLDNILRLNKGKVVKAYTSYTNNEEKTNKYVGTIEATGKDYLIIKGTDTNAWYLIKLIYIDYVEFIEPISYYPYYQE
jgi:spore germination protein Q